MKHTIINRNTYPAGDGMYEEELMCSCGESVHILKSNGTLYDEEPGQFLGFTPKNLECPLLIAIVEEEKWS
jgi:hypothetical protein